MAFLDVNTQHSKCNLFWSSVSRYLMLLAILSDRYIKDNIEYT